MTEKEAVTAREDQPQHGTCNFAPGHLCEHRHLHKQSGNCIDWRPVATEDQPRPTPRCQNPCLLDGAEILGTITYDPKKGTAEFVRASEAQGEAPQENICGTATNAAISMSEDSRPIANSACPSEGLLLPDEEWSHLSQESRDKISKWFRLAVERLQLILDADPARVETGAHPSQDAPGWLIEKSGLCLGNCESRLAWVTFTDTSAIRFSRKVDALNMKAALEWSKEFGKYLFGAVVTEHLWAGARSTPSLPAQDAPPKYFFPPFEFREPVGENDAAYIYDSAGKQVAMLFWPTHPMEETEAAEQETYRIGRMLADAYKANSDLALKVATEELAQIKEHCISEHDCTFCGGSTPSPDPPHYCNISSTMIQGDKTEWTCPECGVTWRWKSQ